MTGVSVVIPWRSHPSRELAFYELLDFFKANHPDINIIISDSEKKNFNLSNARNLGAKAAIESGSEIIIFNDADVFTSPESLRHAIEYAKEHNEVVAPYSLYFQHETFEESDTFLKTKDFNLELGSLFVAPIIDPDTNTPNRMNPCSGSIVVPTNIFLELGGFEENIVGWGPEDVYFHRMYFNKYGRLFTYVPGNVHSTYNQPEVRLENPGNAYYLKVANNIID